MGLIGILILGIIYFLPTIIARNKTFLGQVFLLNLLLGWSIIGWIFALIWSVKYEKK